MKPWMQAGQLVRVQGQWYGEIVDVATGKRTMLLIRSPKGVWRNQSTSPFHRDYAEWLEYREGAIEPADVNDALADLEKYADRLREQLAALESLRLRWVG